ncbi:MAG: hypothetical protein Q8K75_00525 [Chlamydiales bacterium]|nr:hypothetical protein [Chlamydiales bacterium]
MKKTLALSLIFTLASLNICSTAYGLALRPMVIEDRRCDIEMKKLFHQLEKKHHLKLLVTGCGPIVDSPSGRWSVSYMSNQAMTIDQVRPIITDIAKAAYSLVTNDPKFLHAKNLHLGFYKLPLMSQYSPEEIGIKITFWDQNVNRMQQPAVAQVIFTDKTITYRFADPETQALINPIVETLDLTRPQA